MHARAREEPQPQPQPVKAAPPGQSPGSLVRWSSRVGVRNKGPKETRNWYTNHELTMCQGQRRNTGTNCGPWLRRRSLWEAGKGDDRLDDQWPTTVEDEVTFG